MDEMLAEDTLNAQAERLAGSKPLGLTRVGGGGNNRLFRLQTRDRTYALKWYSRSVSDKRNRLAAEYYALSYLAGHMPGKVPQAMAYDAEAGLALYEWIEGEQARPQRPQDIDAAVDFVRQLAALPQDAAALALPDASEAVFAPSDILDQVERRLARLRLVAGDYPALADFLLQDFEPCLARANIWARQAYAAAGRDFATPLPAAQRVLSPSDFGFHNAIRRPNGTLCWIDFEYFGWDDPAKLAGDFPLHPGMELSEAEKIRFSDGLAGIFQKDPDYALRASVFLPLLGLRWGMIVLNEFLQDSLARRNFAGATVDPAVAQARQLDKARVLVKRIDQMTQAIDP